MRKNTFLQEKQILKQCVYFFWAAVFLSIGNYRPNKEVHVLTCVQQKRKNKITALTNCV